MDRGLLIAVLHDVASEKVGEAGDEQFVDFRLIPMHREERREAGQKAVGLWLAINLVYDLCRGKAGVFQELVADVFWQLVLQAVARESFS